MTRSSRAATVLMALFVLICPSCSDGVGVTQPDTGDEPDDVGAGLDETVTGLTDFAGYVGFTEGTGFFSHIHMVDALAVTSSICGQ